MLLRRFLIQNVRSFHEPQELRLDGPISIAIGPNGGGKTNLLDAIVVLLRRYLLSSMYPMHAPSPEQQERYEFRHNDVLNNMILEKHSGAGGLPQIVEGEIEVTSLDIENMESMRADSTQLAGLASRKYVNLNLESATHWQPQLLRPGQRLVYRLENGAFSNDGTDPARHYLEYLQRFEIDSRLRDEYELATLSTPMLYLPVNRSAGPFQSSVRLADFNEFEQKRQNDASLSRTSSSIVALSVGRLAQKYRELLEKDRGTAQSDFRDDPRLKELTEALSSIGYEWSLECIDPIKNHYDIRLMKEGSSFLVGGASSGERELLTYLFAIFALNVRDALILVDEPELHLHPKWQKTLLDLFVRLAQKTGNQFLFATHSPTFVSPHSIEYVSRVFSENQRSRILRLDTAALPESRHLVSIVNSQNNERLFFADKVLLVEGLHDRIFIEAFFNYIGQRLPHRKIVEVLSVGGKGMFAAYERLLRACKIDYAIIADRDYIEQIGTGEIRALFRVDGNEIKQDVLANEKSTDGAALVARIDEAMRNGDWGDARATWEYIKSRRRKLPQDLSPANQVLVDAFCDQQAKEGIHILRLGALEAYLPVGYRSKDTDKLIRLTSEVDFVNLLPEPARTALMNIVEQVLGSPNTG